MTNETRSKQDIIMKPLYSRSGNICAHQECENVPPLSSCEHTRNFPPKKDCRVVILWWQIFAPRTPHLSLQMQEVIFCGIFHAEKSIPLYAYCQIWERIVRIFDSLAWSNPFPILSLSFHPFPVLLKPNIVIASRKGHPFYLSSLSEQIDTASRSRFHARPKPGHSNWWGIRRRL